MWTTFAMFWGRFLLTFHRQWQAIMFGKVTLTFLKLTFTFLNNFNWKEDSIMMFDITYQERDGHQHKLKKSCYFYWLM